MDDVSLIVLLQQRPPAQHSSMRSPFRHQEPLTLRAAPMEREARAEAIVDAVCAEREKC